MKALFITQHNPFGKKGGGSMASHAYLRAVSDCFNGNIDLICASVIRYEEDNLDENIHLENIIYAPDRTKFEKILSVFNGHLNRYITFSIHYLKEHKGVYDYIFFDHNGIGGPLVSVAKKLGIKTVTIHHNLEQEYFSDNTFGLKKKLLLPHVIRWEKKAYKESDINLFLTRQDEIAFKQLYGTTVGKNYVIGSFEFKDYEEPYNLNYASNEKLTFIITGSLLNYQTIDGIKYFFSELYQLLPSDCQIIISGREPTEEVISLCSEHANVMLIPNPEIMDEIIMRADIYICPTRIGGGLKLRVMDGVRNGLPVLVHSRSARGFDSFLGQPCFKVFNDQQTFQIGLTSIINDIKNNCYSRKDICSIYKEKFSYDAGRDRLSSILLDNSIV